MTEQEWVQSNDPWKMLGLIRFNTSNRKLLLFAASSFRHMDYLLPDSRQRRGIELLEQMADEDVSIDSCSDVIEGVRRVRLVCGEKSLDIPVDDPAYVGQMLHRAVARSSPAINPAVYAVQSMGGLAFPALEQEWQATLFRDIIGNPFRPVMIDPLWLSSTVLELARTIYDEKHFERMPILGDALLDTGCDNEAIIQHCQGPGPHVRGCWVVDLLLGKT